MLVRGSKQAGRKQAVQLQVLSFPAHIDGCGYIIQMQLPINTKLYNHKQHEISTAPSLKFFCKRFGVQYVFSPDVVEKFHLQMVKDSMYLVP